MYTAWNHDHNLDKKHTHHLPKISLCVPFVFLPSHMPNPTPWIMTNNILSATVGKKKDMSNSKIFL